MYQTPTGTYLPTSQQQIDEVFKTEIANLCRAYLTQKNAGRAGERVAMEGAIAAFKGAMQDSKITEEAILECYRVYQKAGILKVGTFQLIGWLLAECYPNRWDSLVEEFGLDANHRLYPKPEPIFVASPWSNPEIPSTPPAPAAKAEIEKVTLKAEIAVESEGYRKFVEHVPVDSFIEHMGNPTAHVLVVEDRVNGLPVVNNLIHAVFSHGLRVKDAAAMSGMDSHNPTKGPEFKILDLTGSKYLGFKYVPGVVFHPDTVSPNLRRLNGQSAPLEQDYPPEIWEMVPLLEGAYQAHQAIKGRLKARRKTQEGKPFPMFHRYVLIARWWNVLFPQWVKLKKQGQDKVRQLWRMVYPRNEATADIDLLDVILDYMNLGDLVDCQLVLTTKSISSVKQLGLAEDDMGAFMFLVPGDYNASSGFGFSAINRILKDGRWDFNKFPAMIGQENQLKTLLSYGISYAAHTGHQIVFVGAQSPVIMPLASYHEINNDVIRIEDIDSDSIKKNYEHIIPAFSL